MTEEIISPETQESRARAYCAAQGWPVAMVEPDIDESGYRQHYSKRPGLRNLLAAVERGAIKRVVVWKFSRLSRRLREFLEICDRVERAGGGIVSVTEQTDTSTPAGRLIRNILASFAQFQSEEISEQIFESWMTRARQGRRPPGQPPFGTRNDHGLLVPHPQTHRHLVRMYEIWRDTGNLMAVHRYLTAHHVPPSNKGRRSASDRWHISSIRWILRNPMYIARMDWAGEQHKGVWAPIIEPDLWEAAQRRWRGPMPNPGNRADAHLLTGMIRCGRCSRSMWNTYGSRANGGHRVKVRLYGCFDHSTNRTGCDVPQVHAEELEAAVWDAVVATATMPGLADLVHRLPPIAGAGGAEDGPRQQLLRDEQKEKEAAARLFDLLDAGDISREQFRERNQHHLTRLEAIRRELATLPPPGGGWSPEEALQAAAMVPEATTLERRRAILTAWQTSVTVTERGVYVEMLGQRIRFRVRRLADTYYLHPRYHKLDYHGSQLTDKQTEFLRRTYGRVPAARIAERLGRSPGAIMNVACRLRRQGLLRDVSPDS